MLGDSTTRYLICVPWGEQTIHSRKFNCAFCHCEIAVASGNVRTIDKEKNISPICMKCAAENFSDFPDEEFGRMDDGEVKDASPRAIRRFKETGQF
jgi:hypothetical protein